MEQMFFDFTRVQPEIIGQNGSGAELKLRLGEFAGPLDLLLHLIKQERINIYDIPIARITDEYLRYLRVMKTLDIAVAGDFLVMAATLIEIKSKMLLPRDPLLDADAEDDVDPRRALVHSLLEHQKFKAAAEILWEQATIEQSLFGRGISANDQKQVEVNVGTFDLLNAFQKILARRKEDILLEIERDEMSLAEMIETLRARIIEHKTLNLTELFTKTDSRRQLVLAFLAVLELVRTGQIKLVQIEIFGEITAEFA